MKTFEERYTAWLDGELPEKEQSAFELELEKNGESPAASAELEDFQRFFRSNSVAPSLGNVDFFHHRLSESIGSLENDVASARRQSGWSFPRLAWFGGLSFATALVLFLAIIPKKSETHSQTAYIAQVISARSADPNISATAFQAHPSQTDDMTVVWLDGLDYVPENAQ